MTEMMSYEERRAAERAAELKSWAAFEQWAAEVARNLGLAYIAPEEKGYAINGWLAMGETKVAALDYSSHNGRVELWPIFPDGTYNVTPRGFGNELRISVGRNVEPAKVAKDIGRRFLSPYCELAREANAKLDKANEEKLQQGAAFLGIMGAGGYGTGSNVLTRYQNGEDFTAGFNLKTGYGKVRVGHAGETASIELNYVPAALLIDIVELIAKAAENGEA